jgi:hypothetical protein
MVDDGQQIDWWKIEREFDRKHPSFELGKGISDERKEPTFDSTKEGYDSLLSGEDKILERKKIQKYREKTPPEQLKKRIEQLRRGASRRSKKVYDFKNKALSNAWNVIPEGSPMKQMGEKLFVLMYGCIDPITMCITDHQQNINHSVVMYGTVFNQMTGNYDQTKEKNEMYVEYWYDQQRRWAENNDRDYLRDKWNGDITQCEIRINRNFLTPAKPPLFFKIAVAVWGAVDTAWDGNDVVDIVTKKDIRNFISRDEGYENISDDTWRNAFGIVEKIIYIGESPVRGKDKKDTIRHRNG